MRKLFLFGMLTMVSLTGAISAQVKKDSTTITLEQVDVNAHRNKLYSEMGRIVTVIDKMEISRSAVQSIDQLLDYVAGIDVRQRGVNTTQADISVRGGTFDQVLVLLNGVNITDPQTGHFNLDIPLNLSDVSYVEILQGSAARVLGPNAFSGAINIVTEKGAKKSLNAELTGGSFSTFGQSVSGNIGTEEFHTFASVSHKSSDGYLYNTDFDFSNALIQSVLNTKNAGKFSLQLAGQLKDMGENGFYSLKYPDQRETNKTLLTALDWTLTHGKLSVNAQGSWRSHYDCYELDQNKPAWNKYHLTDVTNGKITGSYSSPLGKTSLGVNVRNEHIFSSSLGTSILPDSVKDYFDKNIYYKYQYNRTVSSGMLDHSVSIGKWFVSAGIAMSYCKDFKSTTYGGIDLGYYLRENVKLYASANSATRLPTFTDMFFVNPAQQGNPSLQPEKSETFEAGVKITQSKWNLNADIYYRLGKNVIDWVKLTSTSPKYQAMNLSEVNATGADISGEYHFGDSFLKKISFGYSYLTLDKSIVGVDSKYALDYLRNKITAGIDHAIYGNLSASWKAGYFDRAGSYDASTVIGQPSNIQKYSPYFMLDTRIVWSMKKLDVFADANNILNSHYADYGGLAQPGINFQAGVRLKL